jgi:hypothetical protein
VIIGESSCAAREGSEDAAPRRVYVRQIRGSG